MLNKQAFFNFKNTFMMSICQDDKLVKGWGSLQFRRWLCIALSFDGLAFLSVKGDTQYGLEI